MQSIGLTSSAENSTKKIKKSSRAKVREQRKAQYLQTGVTPSLPCWQPEAFVQFWDTWYPGTLNLLQRPDDRIAAAIAWGQLPEMFQAQAWGVVYQGDESRLLADVQRGVTAYFERNQADQALRPDRKPPIPHPQVFLLGKEGHETPYWLCEVQRLEHQAIPHAGNTIPFPAEFESFIEQYDRNVADLGGESGSADKARAEWNRLFSVNPDALADFQSTVPFYFSTKRDAISRKKHDQYGIVHAHTYIREKWLEVLRIQKIKAESQRGESGTSVVPDANSPDPTLRALAAVKAKRAKQEQSS